KLNEVDHIILGLLNHEPMSGYDIKGRIEYMISYFYPEIGFNKIYPSLKKLETAKMISLRIDDTDYPPKKIYSVTKLGKEQLISWLSEPLHETHHGFTLFQEFLVKLHFSSEVPREIVLRNIEFLEGWFANTIGIFNQYENQLNKILDSEDHKFYLLNLLFGKTVYESLDKWINQAKKTLMK
nr:PadR family transcriptional regulator [Asgard group archaeon]